MRNLPEGRVNIAVLFELTDVDYAGPVSVKEGKHKPKIVKAYIALSVCLGTKAVYLELVSDLTSDAPDCIGSIHQPTRYGEEVVLQQRNKLRWCTQGAANPV